MSHSPLHDIRLASNILYFILFLHFEEEIFIQIEISHLP